MRLGSWTAQAGGAVMVVGGGGGGGVRGVVVLVVVVLGVVLGGEGSGFGGERLPRSPLHTRALQNSILSSAPEEDMKAEVLSRYPGQDDYISPTREVWAADGRAADLKCNLTSPLPKDAPRLVLWYKKGLLKPIYSYDMRNGPALHRKINSHLGSRITFDAPRHALNILRVRLSDAGIYRCRVHFRTNPTLTYTTNLSVLIPPRHIVVYTELGDEAKGIIGPYVEGDNLTLHCRVRGGFPPPRVTWWEGEVLLDGDVEEEESEVVTNTLQLPQLARDDLNKKLTCRANNNNLTEPLVTSVAVDMHFPPLWVEVLGERRPLSAGRPYDIKCQVIGARPPAIVTWRLDDKRLTSHSEKLTEEGNVTRSELRWTPSVRDEGRILACRAESPTLSNPPLTDRWKLQIYHVPMTRLRPGRSLNLSNIEEGDDVYFECSIKANPPVTEISWLHEGKKLEHNVTAGVIISNQSLVLQKVTRAASGDYYCVATNIEGDGHSNPIVLRVKYAPVCKDGQEAYHGAAKHEEVRIPCQLDAHPLPTSFKWTFNNSGESVDIPESHMENGGWQSVVRYTPNTELDYGTMLCWGANPVGIQATPCVFHIFPAGRPDPVHNCSVYNLSVTVVNVRCVAGFDGGLPQTFILELYEPLSHRLLANVTSSGPEFSVSGLSAGLTLMGVVFSTNEKGRGEMVSFPAYTIKDVAERRTAAVKPPPAHDTSSPPLTIKSIIALTVGGAVGLLVMGVVACVVVKLRSEGQRECGRHQRLLEGGVVVVEGRGKDEGGGATPLPTTTHTPTTIQDLPLPPASSSTVSSRDTEEVNPDLIPHTDSEVRNVGGVTTISTSTLPATYTTLQPSYATLPRATHLHSHAYQQTQQQSQPQQHQEGGCSLAAAPTTCATTAVRYAELLLTGPAPAVVPLHHFYHHPHPQHAAPTPTTPPPPPPPSHRVMFTTPDPHHHHHHHHLMHHHHHHPHYPHVHTHVAGATPTHSPHTLRSATQTQEDSGWQPTERRIVRRHSLRRDPYICHEKDSQASLLPSQGQKESSV
ncbi:nephrin-like [Eriocheir sinensis]|uniref:nephrin-like n=1 Tax=Eriocheir sinensis TaxID=95602 RepID=UPI0021C70770|nr:nephrin-like [Eriocheir sinensis]